MFNDDLSSTIIKAIAMLIVILAEYWVMQPYHEPLLARLWASLARLCYRIALRFGSLGMGFENNYYEAIS